MKESRITTKVSLLCGACAAAAFVCALWLLSQMAANTALDEQIFRAALHQADLAKTMQVDFKKQVQEWKDVLLRGHKEADFEKYWRQFIDEESQVKADGRELAAAVDLPAVRTEIAAFLKVHEDLGRRYRESMEVFAKSGRTDYKSADVRIRGMDRAPTDMIDHIVGLIEKEQTEYFASRQAALGGERRFTTAGIAVVLLGIIAASIWSIRRITAPIVNLTSTIAKVSGSKDYSLRAPLSGSDELRRLAKGFNEMLTKIQEQNTALQLGRDDLNRRVEELKRINGELGESLVHRQQSEYTLASSLSVLNATLESTADGLLVVNADDQVTAFNKKFGEMWHIPPGLLETRDDHRILSYATAQLSDPPAFLEKVLYLYSKPEAESFDVLTFKDGRVFERYSQPQRINGISVGRVWSFRDITLRKRGEAELERLNKELMETARQAGMAEVATGVLHNVGNVLNSVNVASSSMVSSLKRSKSAQLSKVVALMREHEANLGDFLTLDPKGKQLLGYLAQLGEHLEHEHNSVLKELNELQMSVEHIKDIVTRQQSVSTLSSAFETVKACELFEDAAKMDQSSLSRHGIEVIREFDGEPQLTTDRNQVVQILVNLVRNAIHACTASEQGKKLLTLHLLRTADQIGFVVTDNGIGIAPENLPRIFTHGFTTKKDGHGFGLHSCALIARKLGGSLSVKSEGLEKGAAFTLTLPVEPPKQAAA